MLGKVWNQQVGVKAVREQRGVMAHEKAEKGFFMAPKGFTDEARAFAAANGIMLIGGRLFVAMLQRLLYLRAEARSPCWQVETAPSITWSTRIGSYPIS